MGPRPEAGRGRGAGRRAGAEDPWPHTGPSQICTASPFLSLHRELDFYFPKFSISSTTRLETLLPRAPVGGGRPGQPGLAISKVGGGGARGSFWQSLELRGPTQGEMLPALALPGATGPSALGPHHCSPATSGRWLSWGGAVPSTEDVSCSGACGHADKEGTAREGGAGASGNRGPPPALSRDPMRPC